MSVTCSKTMDRESATREARRAAALLVVMAVTLAACSSTPKASPTVFAGAPASASVVAAPANSALPVTATAPTSVVPPEAEQKFAVAMQLVNAGKNDEAALQLEQLANEYPALAAPLINAGVLYLKASQFEAAERALKRAVERDTKSPVANTYLGVAERNLGKFKNAEASYRAALSTDDTYAPAHLNLGILYDLYLQQPEQALSEYQRYQELLSEPDNKVAGWIKELKARLGKKAPAAGDKS